MISVIVPIYNAEEYLNKCLASIVNQTYRDIEIILVENNSTDSSANILMRVLLYVKSTNKLMTELLLLTSIMRD